MKPAIQRRIAVLIAAAAAGCASSPVRVPVLDDAERVRGSEAAREGAQLAPQVFARAERARDLAQAARATGDAVVAKLQAERAIAAYGHALVIARLAVAEAELAEAQHALDAATAQAQALDTSRLDLEREADELTERARVARERLLPPASSTAGPDRRAARLAAARSLAVEARLLCGAARLVAPGTSDDLASAEDDVARLGQVLAPSGPHHDLAPRKAGPDARSVEPVDAAGAARARCLDALTRVRRNGAGDGGADALLAELSAAGQWSPSRDERGVVVTLRGAFRGAALSERGEAMLKELGQVAAAHPAFALQVVVHDSLPPVPADDDARRADVTVKALVDAGAAAAKIKAELAGTLAPLVDPDDAAFRSRNERVDVVFVSGG